jgi:hypothetical protein
VGSRREPQAGRSHLRARYWRVGPSRDHVDLDDAELRALAGLESALRARSSAPRRFSRARRWLGSWRLHTVLVLLTRLAPWLVAIGTALMVAAISTSVVLSFAGALLVAVGLAAVFDRLARRVRGRAARRSGSGPPPPR